MKKNCRIEVESTRRYLLGESFGDALPQDAEEMWEMLDEELPEELEGELPTDRKGDQLFAQPEAAPPSSSVLSAYGVLSEEEDGSIRISYEDSEITGLPGCLTTFCLTPQGPVILLRRGEIRTCMIFEEGARHLCDYGTELSVPSVVLHTHRLESSMGERGGELLLDYSVEIRGALAERNQICLRVGI